MVVGQYKNDYVTKDDGPFEFTGICHLNASYIRVRQTSFCIFWKLHISQLYYNICCCFTSFLVTTVVDSLCCCDRFVLYKWYALGIWDSAHFYFYTLFYSPVTWIRNPMKCSASLSHSLTIPPTNHGTPTTPLSMLDFIKLEIGPVHFVPLSYSRLNVKILQW